MRFYNLGKGSDPRPMEITKEEFDKNFDRIFNKNKKPKTKKDKK